MCENRIVPAAKRNWIPQWIYSALLLGYEICNIGLNIIVSHIQKSIKFKDDSMRIVYTQNIKILYYIVGKWVNSKIGNK